MNHKALFSRGRLAIAFACAVALCLCMVAGLTACGGSSSSSSSAASQSSTRTFTDSAGRQVQVPASITKIAPSGFTAQQVLLTIAPDKLVGLAQKMSDSQIKYLGSQYASLPEFGAAFGAKGNLNKEAVAASGAQILIDTGEYKDGIAADLDKLQEQLGIPCVFIETKLSDYGSAYTMLGDLLGTQDRAKTLADYCTNAYNETKTAVDAVPEAQRVKVAYLSGDAGLNAIAKGSYQGGVIDMCATNVVQVEKASGSGTGNEISLEQLANWNPQMIVFQQGSIYSKVGSDAAWQGIAAIANKNYYECPNDPWCWLNNPPTVNQVMGMQWFSRLCYPDKFKTSISDVTKSYYKTFYGYDLSDAEPASLTANAVAK